MDSHGNDLNAQMTPYLGANQHYFINSRNYKSYSNEKLKQLYNAETNTYYAVVNDTVSKVDGSESNSGKVKVKKLNYTENILGYTCQAVQIETDLGITIYFYTPQIKVNKQEFARHNYGDWNKYLEATDGALTLKHIYRPKKYNLIWTATATSITPMDLTAADFVLPGDLPIKR